MLSKKAAGLIGLGATVVGTAGSQMVSADLSDFIKNKEKRNNYIQEINQVRDWAAVLNVTNKIYDLVSGNNDPDVLILENDNIVVDAIRETITEVSVKNVKDKLEKFKNDAKGLKSYCNSPKYKTVYDANAAKVLKRLTAEYDYNLNPEIIEKIWVTYSNNVSNEAFKKNTVEEQIEFAKQEGVNPEELVSGLLEKVNVQIYDSNGKSKDVHFKDSDLYKRLFDFNEEDELDYLIDYNLEMENTRNRYNKDKTIWNIDENEYALRLESGPVRNYYKTSDRGRMIFLNKIGYYERNIKKWYAKASAKFKEKIENFSKSLVEEYLIPGGKLASIAAEPFTKYFVSKSKEFFKNTIKDIVGEEFFSNKDNNIPEEEEEFFTKENIEKTIDKMLLETTGINEIEEKFGESVCGAFFWDLLKEIVDDPFEGFNERIIENFKNGYLKRCISK